MMESIQGFSSPDLFLKYALVDRVMNYSTDNTTLNFLRESGLLHLLS